MKKKTSKDLKENLGWSKNSKMKKDTDDSQVKDKTKFFPDKKTTIIN